MNAPITENCLLTDQEKRRFSDWLELQIYSGTQMVEQFEKLRVPPELIKRERVNIAAFQLVLRYINSGETVQVGK